MFHSLLPPSPVLAPRPASPLIQVKRTIERPRWRWEGIITARSWPTDMSEEEYRLMLVGGRRRRLASPDCISVAGVPIYLLTDAERRARERLLARALDTYQTHNVACDAGRTVLLNMIASAGGVSGVSYFAVGTGTPVTPAAGDTQLVTEYFRKLLTTTTISGNQVDLSTSFATTEANTTYTEAGLFGNGATSTPNSGTLFTHAIYNYTKTSEATLSNDYTIFLN